MTDCVTVVVTCYNHEQYIEECLRSVFSQTHQDIALIVINDGSTDASTAVIEQVLTKKTKVFVSLEIWDLSC